MNDMIKQFSDARASFAEDLDVCAVRVDAGGGRSKLVYQVNGRTQLNATDAHAVREMSAALRKLPAFRGQDDRKVQDSAENFVTSSLSRVLGAAENVRRPTLPLLFVPGPSRKVVLASRNLVKPGLRTIEYEVRAQTGQAQWVDPASTRELQNADYVGERKIHGADYSGIRYGYTTPETWEDDILGGDMIGEREASAMQALDNFEESVSGWGAADRNIPGLLNYGSALLVVGGQFFASGSVTAIEMLRAIGSWESMYSRANGDLKPDGAIIPEADRVIMATTFLPNTLQSAWERAMILYPWMANSSSTNRLNSNAGSGPGKFGYGRWVLYNNDPLHTYFENTPSMVFGPFIDEMRMSFVVLRRHGGLVAKLPERIVNVDFTS